MKKVKIWLATLVALVVCACCLAACNGGVEGKYKFYSMTIGGETYKAGQEVNMGVGSMKISKDLMILELKSDGTCEMTSSMDEDMSGTGTWKKDEEDENKIIVTIDGDSVTFTKDGSKLVLEMDTGIMGTIKYELKK